MNEIPSWAASLVAIGEKTAATVDVLPSRGLTIALCLPRIDYAAVLVGLGIIKRRLSMSSTESHKERMKSLLGKWVSFDHNPYTVVGILDFCDVEKTFQVRHFKKKIPALNTMTADKWAKFTPPKSTDLWTVVDPRDWIKVRPAGREFNPNRLVTYKQTQKIDGQNLSISILSNLMGCDLGESALGRSGSIFCVYGNKTRLNQELTDSLFADEEACLGKVLRPKGNADYADSFHCSIEGHKFEMPDNAATFVIIESGRSLPDQLSASQNFNRIILIGRNSVNYDECAAQIMEESINRRANGPDMDTELPGSIRHLAFYHR